MLKRFCAITVVLLAVMLLPTAVQGAVINYNFPIDGPQANAGLGTGSGGLGTGIVAFNTTTNALSWNISYGGLGTVTAAHFHGPALTTQNAGVQVGIGTANAAIGNAVLSNPQEADLLAGLWYVNIHTIAFPGGEIRGQVVPETSTFILYGLGSLMIMRRRQRVNR
jgi:hypothetical protein